MDDETMDDVVPPPYAPVSARQHVANQQEADR